MKPDDKAFSLIRCGTGDEQRILALAELVWKPTFSKILSADRLEYLFGLMYDPEKLRSQLSDTSQHYYLLAYGDEEIGYSQLCFYKDWVKLEKLYVLETMQGKGCGLYLLRSMLSEAIRHSIFELRLQVNRGNKKAIEFYHKFGFRTIASRDFNVGGGHYMEDFEMSYIATPLE